MTLTSNQIKIRKEIGRVLEKNNVVYVCGPDNMGRKHICKDYISDYGDKGVVYNLVEAVGYVQNGIEIKLRLENWIKTISNDIECVLIIGWEDLLLHASSVRFKMSTYAHWFILDFTKQLENKHFKSIIIVERHSAQTLVSKDTWMVDVEVKEEDIKEILERYNDDEIEIKEALAFTKKSNLADVITYASQAAKGITEGETWIERYRSAQQLANPRSIDIEKEVFKPQVDVHMLGIEHIIEQMERDVINPIVMQSQGVPICRGILLYGPSGTGKTTIGRWLSYRLKGKVYLCERTRNESIMGVLSRLMTEAANNAPAVVFVDDIDSLLHNPEYVRDLLVLLDGIKLKGRDQVTVIMTCMDISLVPSALHRGGRMEVCIEFKYPTIDVVTMIIKNRFEKSINDLRKTHSDKAQLLENEINPTVIRRMSQIVNGWSPSNIHLLIDIIMRHVAINQYGVYDIFVEEANKLQQLSKKTNSSNHDHTPNSDIYM